MFLLFIQVLWPFLVGFSSQASSSRSAFLSGSTVEIDDMISCNPHHDFFVFKSEETGKNSVIYKRNAGGVGLIEL